MTVERIDCANDPRLAPYRDVGDGELLRERRLFVAEGRLVVRRAIEDRRYAIRSMLVNDAALRDLGAALEMLDAAVPVLVCRTGDFLHVTGIDIHRGCLALVERPAATLVDHLIYSVQTLVVLEAVANADNVGGVFRNAAAFGAGGVLLSPTCCDPLYRKAIRTSMGASLSVPFARAGDGDWPGVLTRVRAAGFTIVALTLGDPAETLDAFAAGPRASRVALMVGTEGAGLTPAVEAEADARVRIPINEDVDSLNVAVAVGIALYRLRRTGTV